MLMPGVAWFRQVFFPATYVHIVLLLDVSLFCTCVHVTLQLDDKQIKLVQSRCSSCCLSCPSQHVTDLAHSFVQNLMQVTEAQKAGITQVHTTKLTNLAQIATRHQQQLLQQLQDAPQAQGLHFQELAACHEQLDAVYKRRCPLMG